MPAALGAIWLATLLPQLWLISTDGWRRLDERLSPNADFLAILGYGTLVAQSPGYLVTSWLCNFLHCGSEQVQNTRYYFLGMLTNAAVYFGVALFISRPARVFIGSTTVRILDLALKIGCLVLLLASITAIICFARGLGVFDSPYSLSQYIGFSIVSLSAGILTTLAVFRRTT